jgi:hypothetical protein
MRKPKEGDLVKACLNYLALRNIFAWRNNTGAYSATYNGKTRFTRFGQPGSPDIIGMLRPYGRFFGVECKGPTGKQTELQKAFQCEMEQNGGVYILARNLDDVDNVLKNFLETSEF